MNHRTQKKLTAVIALLAGIFTFTALPQKAEAEPSYSQRRLDHICVECNQPVYAYRKPFFYGNHGRPSYRWDARSHSGNSHASRNSGSHSRSNSNSHSSSGSHSRSSSRGHSYRRPRASLSH